MKKRALCWLLALVMILSLVPFSALAEGETLQATDPNAVAEEKTNLTPGEMTTDSMVTNKWVDEHDGQYDITMTSYATGGTMTQELESDVPLDIVLVLDQSGSMKYDDISAGYTPQNGPWTPDQAIGWYHKVGDNYYEVRAKSGTVYTPTVRPRLSDNLMGVTGESLHMSWNSWQTPYYVKDQSGNLVPLYVRTIGYPLGYDAQFYYYENGTATLIYFTNGSDTASYSRGGIGTGSMDSNSYRLDTTVYKSSTGYKQLYYVDANGNKLGDLGNPVTVTSDSAWDGPLYYNNSNQTRLQALQQAAQKFLTLVGEKADAGNVDHRVAIAGFASNNFPAGSTTKSDIVTGSNQYNYVNTGLFIQQTNGDITFDNFQVIFDSDSNRFSQVTAGPVVDTTPYYYSTDGRTFYPMKELNGTWYRYSWNNSNELVGTAINITTALNNGYLYEPYTYDLTPEDYRNALVNVRSGDDNGNHVNDFLDTAINSLGAYGGTYVSYGIAMANNVFANNDNVIQNADGTTTERKRVIVVFTDGEPGANGFDEAVANEALNNAAISKETYGASVYTIGLFVDKPGSETGETAVDPRARTFIHQLSSEYYTSLEKVYKEDLDVNSTYYALDENGMVYAASTTAPDNTSLLCGWHLDDDENNQLKYDGIYRYPKINRNDTNSGRAQFYSRSGNSYNEIWVQAQTWTEWWTTYSTPAMEQNTVYYSKRSNQYQPYYYAYRWNNNEGTLYDPISRGTQDPYATKLTQFYQIKSTTPTNQGTYAFEKANAAGLASAFQTISESIQTPYTTVSLTKQNSYFADTVTKEFIVPANAQATLSVQRMAYDAVSGKITPVADDDPARATAIVAGLTQTWTTNADGSKTLKVEGFDYSEYYVAEGHPGYQLVVKIENLTTSALGKLYTNDSNSGVFKEGTLVAPLPMPYIIKEAEGSETYVMDFGAKMNIAESGKFQVAVSSIDGKNGTFFNSDTNGASGTISYQLKAGEALSDGANLAFNGVDTAIIYGNFYVKNETTGAMEAASGEGTWKTVNVIPANTVYFDDSFTTADFTVGEGTGYNASVQQNESSPETGSSKQTLTFNFTGTGIDVYCTTDKANGWIQATVDGTNKQPYTNTKFDDGNNTTLYNIPVISFRDLGAGTHTLVITTLTDANFRLDGIRVYNPMQEANGTTPETVNSAYEAANEQNAVFLKVRDYLLASGFGSNTGDDAFTGAVFTDKQGDKATVAEYTTAGPKNEVYLAKNQGVAFTINNWSAYKNSNKVMVSLSVPAGGSATVAASGRTGNDKITVDAQTHMYYDITPDENGNVYILNTGDSMVSVADLKITGTEEYTVTRGFTLGAPVTADETGGMLKASPRMLMAYVESFDPEAVVEVPEMPDDPDTPDTPGTPDEPDTPDTPDEPDDPKPGWNDGAYDPTTILKSLFQSLAKSLFNLFHGLGGW